jgi:DNA-binding transcriptional regulator YhcF (GntR family)
MLDSLFGSKARVKVLKLFLLNSEKKYYLRQLARDLDLQVNSVRRELKNLETFGLLVSSIFNHTINKTTSQVLAADQTANESKIKSAGLGAGKSTGLAVKQTLATRSESQDKKYYQANKNFVLFAEIKALILKSQILAGKNFASEVKKICVPKLLVLTGFFTGSLSVPTDILLVAKAPKIKLAEAIKKLEQEVGREINYTVMDENEFKYRQEIADVFLHTILESKKIVLINDFDFLF